LHMVGYCESEACARAARSAAVGPQFQIATYGSPMLYQTLRQCDLAGEVAIVTPQTNRWRYLRVPDSDEAIAKFRPSVLLRQ
jgi:hypothetical protein